MSDKLITVDGLATRYIEAGSGHPVLLLHGGSLGSSADVFRRNLPPLAAAGLRPIAFDQPGFGLTDIPADLSNGYRRTFIPKLIDALRLARSALVAHSQAGGMAVELVLAEPERYSHLVILGTGSLLPPMPGAADASGEESRPVKTEPTRETTRKLLESQLFHHELITPEELELRYSRSIGRPFEAFVARSRSAGDGGKAKAKADAKPLWQRLAEIRVPLLMIYGREDRANAFERANLLKQAHPQLDLRIVTGCKHMVPWDAADEYVRLTIELLRK